MKYKILIITMMLGLAVVQSRAQTARVVALTATDANKIASLEKQKKDIETQIDEFNKDIAIKYLTTDDPKQGCTESSIRKNESDKSDPNPYGATGGIFVMNGTSTVSIQNCNTLYGSCWYQERKETAAEKAKEQEYKSWEQRHPFLFWKWCPEENSFEYSKDYLFIVPKLLPVSKNSVLTVTPATGAINLWNDNGSVR